MWILRMAAVGAAAAGLGLAAADVQGDAQRGEQFFQAERCIQCHAINGRGGTMGPDLGKHLDRDFTPAAMASLIWTHAPRMWSAMRQAGIEQGTLSEEAVKDLFAYFIAARYFEKPGDAARGKQAFTTNHCSQCHGLTASNAANAPAVVKWESLTDPIVLIQQMWNHGPGMRQAYADQKLRWSPLTAQELKDILVYLQGLPQNRALVTAFSFPPSQTGPELFQSKGCAECHTGKLALDPRLRNQSLSEVAVDMWNHQGAMKQTPPNFSQEEMRQLLGYIWIRPYFRGGGDASHGKKVFAEKYCASCHDKGTDGAPKLGKTAEGYSSITLISSLWRHGPRMLELMNQRNVPWPRFTAPEMSDLIAYLNSL